MYGGFSKSVRGGSHIRTGTVCQDNSGCVVSDHYSIAVVADGHGGSKHFRSDVGSKLAVEVSLQTLKEYMSSFREFEDALDENHENLIRNIKRTIISRWNLNVNDYDSTHPLTTGESTIMTDGGYENEPYVTRYGTTLVIGVLGDSFSFGIQIGDGDFVRIIEGEADQPMPGDPNCILNITTSLCQTDSFNYTRDWYSKGPVDCIIVSTDGLSTSYVSTESFLKGCQAFAVVAGKENSDKMITEVLEKRSRVNQEDDVSMSIIYRITVDNATSSAVASDSHSSIKARIKKALVDYLKNRKRKHD